MKRICATAAVLVLSTGFALAQSSGGAGSSGGTGASSPGSSTTAPTPPSASPAARPATPPAPSDSSTTGRAPGVNPANSQDQTNRGNPQDLTRPGASNPQDMKPSGNTPSIIAPERR